MKEHDLEVVSDTSNKYDTCAKPQTVLYCGSAGDKSSEESPLGAFILAAAEIFATIDLEGEQDGDDTND